MLVFSFFTFSAFPYFTGTSVCLVMQNIQRARMIAGVWENLTELVGVPENLMIGEEIGALSGAIFTTVH